MVDELTKAKINLFAVLRNLEDLFELDDTVKSLIGNKTIAIQFSVRKGPKALLKFNNGKCSLHEGKGKCNIKLYFKSPAHLNRMFDGKANPIPLKGLTKIGFLTKEFVMLTQRLSHYLKPTSELLSDSGYFKINTFLTAYTAFFALAQIGNTDPIGILNAKRIPDGVICITVKNGGPSLHLMVKDGHLQVGKGPGESPRAIMSFASIEVANAILNGRLDSYTAIGSGDFQVHGYIPMLDNMNKLLIQVSSYLK